MAKIYKVQTVLLVSDCDDNIWLKSDHRTILVYGKDRFWTNPRIVDDLIDMLDDYEQDKPKQPVRRKRLRKKA